MKKTSSNLTLLSMIFVVALVMSDVVATKIVDVPIALFGGRHIQLSGSAFCYAITFLITDVIGEIWGTKEANECVLFGLVCGRIASLLISFIQFLPAVSAEMQTHYEAILGQDLILVIVSVAAYLLSQTWNVYIFHRIRGCFIKKYGRAKHKWVWSNASTITSQIIHTVSFIGIAFGIGSNWLFTAKMRPVLFAMMIEQCILKAVLALLDTPFFYLLTRKSSSKKVILGSTSIIE